MFENIINFFKSIGKREDKKQSQENSKDAAKERLHLVLMQDRANVSADFLELMKQEIIDVIKKYIEIDEKEIDVRLTNKENEDGTNGAPALYANIPILNIKNDARKINKNDVEEKQEKQQDKAEEEKDKEEKQEDKKEEEKKEEEIKEEEIKEEVNKETENKENPEENNKTEKSEQEQKKEVEEKAEIKSENKKEKE